MPRSCPLCETDTPTTEEFLKRFGQHFVDETDGERLDYLAFKRDLEGEYGLSLTVSAVKRHDLHHIEYSLPDDPEAMIELAERLSEVGD